ncbi:MAG TPA: carboxypeptidase-like regulatory domain-containing protein, partial [Gemmatimonadaceae bacterium]
MVSRASLALLGLFAAGPLAAQGIGSVRGVVIDAGLGRGIPDVQVSIVGTRRGGVTGENGRYVIVGATPGRVTIRAQKLGYAPVTQAVTIVAGDSVVADFRLATAALALDEVVITGTPGATEK